MEEVLQHDPRTKSQIKDILYAFLYEPVQKKFKQCLDTIINKNTAISGYTHKSFTYKGVMYSNDTSSPPRRLNRLHPQLQADMDNYIREVKLLNDNELPYVVGFITQVLNSSNDLHDYLRVLPSAVHLPIEKLIASCPCRTKRLTEEMVEEIQTKNQTSIALMKRRMVQNLLI